MKKLLQEKTVCREQLFTGRVFQVEVRQVMLSDGSQAEREIVLHAGGACIVPLDKQKNVHMICQYRSPFDQVMLEIPAGKLEPGEEPLACAARELAEETGYRAGRIVRLATVFPSPGYCSEILHIFLGTDLAPGVARPDQGEILDCRQYQLDLLLSMIDRGEICDAKTIIALLTLDRWLRSGQLADTGTEGDE